MEKIDVTSEVSFSDDCELVFLKKCVCGKIFDAYEGPVLDSEGTEPFTECPSCNRKYFFSKKITIWEVKD
jgi:hypothetical protein